MRSAHIAITTDAGPGGVRVACFITGDPQIDHGLRPYLERSGLALLDYEPDVVGSQIFTINTSSDQEQREILTLVEAYYVSWGKEPSVASVDDIIR
jgi:hypothetical protein